MILIHPRQEHLPSYVAALQRGYQPSSTRPSATAEALQLIDKSPERFLSALDDPDALADPVQLPDGSVVARLPSIERWMWDGEFSGSISLRWQNGTADLPPTCMGHVGYSVVPWKRSKGYATAALGQMLPEARTRGLPFVEVVTALENVASQRVVLANGGNLVERFEMPASNGRGPALRYRIPL